MMKNSLQVACPTVVVIWDKVAEGHGRGPVFLMSCFFKIAQGPGAVECGWTVLWLSVFDRKFNQDRVKWVGNDTHRSFCLENKKKGTERFLPISVCEGVSLCVFKSGYMCLVHALCWWPLIAQSILIQSASFSHDCHTLAAAMATCRSRKESARVREVRCLFFNHCDIYAHIMTQGHGDIHVCVPSFTERFCR